MNATAAPPVIKLKDLTKVFSTDGQTYIQAVSTMTGMSVDDYRNMMMAGGRSIEGNRYIGEKK